MCGILQGSMLILISKKKKKLEADPKSLSKIDDLLGFKRSGKLLCDDHDAPTSGKNQ